MGTYVVIRGNQNFGLFHPASNSVKDFKIKQFYIAPVNDAVAKEVVTFTEKG